MRAYQHRRLLRVLVDCGLWFLALYAAALLRLDFDLDRLDGFHIAILLPIAWAGQAAIGWYYGLYRGRWINGSFDEVSALGRTAFATTVVLLAVDLLFPRTRPAPASAVIGAGLLAFLAMGGARYAARHVLESQRRQRPNARCKRAIIFGAGDGGERTIRAMIYDDHSPYVPVALLDDDPNKRNLTLRGVKVIGDRTKLREAAETYGAKALVIAVPTGDGALVRELSDLAREVGLEMRVVPAGAASCSAATCTSRTSASPPRSTSSAGTRSRPTCTRCRSTSPASGSSSPAPAAPSAPSSAASCPPSSPPR